jgi:sec-independent protein translocase protein TatA
MGSLGITEVLLILVIALLVFGPGKVPEVARGLGKALRQFNKFSSGLTAEFREEFEKEFDPAPAAQDNKQVGSGQALDDSGSAPVETEQAGTCSDDEP